MTLQVDVLDLEKIEPRLRTKFIARPTGGKNELWESINSTNTRAIEVAADGGAHGTLILARQQSAGRGRLGRQWVSPSDSGIYSSFLLRPEAQSIPNLSTITLAVGVAVSKAIRNSVGIEVGLKWVNDLVVDGRKLGGILCEMTSNQSGKALIIGIGINVRFDENELPDDLKEKMIWLERITKQPVDPNSVIAEIANQLEEVYGLLLNGQSDKVLAQWRTRSITLGRRIIATSGERTVEGDAVDIAASGALIVDTGSEKIELHAGEITIRNADGSYC
ncbi:MAG: biotin--[acetyl-CoA-carboxylase] ligase [Candidatus Melainabacteria bacterium]|nr:biotin--[acetyl-CoA-carboxylase] ligase [Candidatus Melainabacteria bacterium]